MSTADLAGAIESHSLTTCYYVILNCPDCGELRAAIQDMPTSRFIACPCCQRESDYKISAKGGTTRNLPFWQRGGYWLKLPWQGRLY